MAYSKKISRTINAQSVVDGQLVATMSANIPDYTTAQGITSNVNITNKELYAKHKKEVLADIQQFNDDVYGEDANQSLEIDD